jgi:hypothetical protein
LNTRRHFPKRYQVRIEKLPNGTFHIRVDDNVSHFKIGDIYASFQDKAEADVMKLVHDFYRFRSV